MRIERLLTVPNSQEAALIQHRLENIGVDSFTTNEIFSNLMPHYYGLLGSGIQIMVDDESLEKARDTLFDFLGKATDLPRGREGTQLIVGEKGWDKLKQILKSITRKTTPMSLTERITKLKVAQRAWVN